MAQFSVKYSTLEGEEKNVPLSSGSMMFVVGANGTGKTSLMHAFFVQNARQARRVSANRQVWLDSNRLDLTPASRVHQGKHLTSQEQQAAARWKDTSGASQSQMTIFDLIDRDNMADKAIAAALRHGDHAEAERLAKMPSPIETMNSILRVSNLDIEVSIEAGGSVMARRGSSEPYSIAEMSDGERNAVLIIATVLTCDSDTLILLDEPERHLHRSIVSPLLTSLLAHREDCAFIISTHDISLPLDQHEASALLVRSYRHHPPAWEADYVPAVHEIDDAVAGAILGARRKILFVEGDASSLDRQIFQILYPDVSVLPMRTCLEVERAVRGVRATGEHHWVTAFGLVDGDQRSEETIRTLQQEGVSALAQYSVESLYYHPTTIRNVARQAASFVEIDPDTAVPEAHRAALEAIGAHASRMALRTAERRIRVAMMAEAPSWKDLRETGENPVISVNTATYVVEELEKMQGLLAAKDLAALISHYPVRETPALDKIARSLNFSSRQHYEGAVRKMLTDDVASRDEMLALLEPLTRAIRLGTSAATCGLEGATELENQTLAQ